MKKLYVTVGLPRSGKSTWRKENAEKLNAVTISADDLRIIVYGERFKADREGDMWNVRRYILSMLLSQGVNIIIDETNTTRKRRQPIIDMAKGFGYEVTAVVLETTPEVCKQRAEAINDKAILPVIERMATQFEPVTDEEGFDHVITM